MRDPGNEVGKRPARSDDRDACIDLIIHVNPLSAPPSTPSFQDALEK